MKLSMFVVIFLWVSLLLQAQEMDLKALENLKTSIKKIKDSELAPSEKETKIKALFIKAISEVETAKSNFTRTYQFDKSKRAKGILEQLKVGKIDIDSITDEKKESSKPKTAEAAKYLKELFTEDLLDNEGKPFNLNLLNNKVVAIYFSAHWCPPCQKFTPSLVKLRNENAANFEVVFVSSDSSEAAKKKYIEETGMKWPSVKLNGADGKKLMSKFEVNGIPMLIIISKSGEVITKDGRGEISNESIKKWSDKKENTEKKEISVKEESLPLTIEESIFPKLNGYWEFKDDTGDAFIKFETDRIRLYTGSQGLMFFRAQYSKERIWCFYNATPFSYKIIIINPDKIEFDSDGKKMIFTKTDKILPKLEITPFSFGNAIVTDEEKATIQQELTKRLKTDQEVRTKKELASKAHEVDTANTKYLKEVISKFGWPDASRFGAESANIAFLIVQHSGDLSLMLPSLASIEKDVKAKKIDGQDFALLYDRLNLNIGRKQKYGSQVIQSKEGMIVLPCEDKDKVEQFRRELGIFSLASYLRMFGQNPSTKPNFYEDKIPQ